MSDPKTDAITLTIAGQVFSGFLEISIDTSIDAMAAALEIKLSERFPGHPDRWVIAAGAPFTVAIGGELVATGFIDEINPEVSATEHTPEVRGRGRTCDLVDCSALNKPGSWKNQSALKIIADLAKPFSIAVTAQGPLGAAQKAFALQQGETVKEAIDRLVMQRGILPIETATGDLLLASAGSAGRAAGGLRYGGNVTAAKAKHSMLERFSLYVVKGQRQGDDADNGAAVSQVSGQATDPDVPRYRPLLMISEDQATAGSATARAKMAATVRAGRAQQGTFTVAGYRDAAGVLWRPNTLVSVDAAIVGIEGELLITGVKRTKGPQGSTSEITVMRPEAFSLGAVKGGSVKKLTAGHKADKPKKRKAKKGADLNTLRDLIGGGGTPGPGGEE